MRGWPRPSRRPGLYYPLGDGTSHGDGWSALDGLVRHLRAPGAVSV
ncbi:DUF6177 family protein [Streptomyces sp. I05A-00742]|nr:DUF6177 family protein [Streptomyces sp. I05A-00742]